MQRDGIRDFKKRRLMVLIEDRSTNDRMRCRTEENSSASRGPRAARLLGIFHDTCLFEHTRLDSITPTSSRKVGMCREQPLILKKCILYSELSLFRESLGLLDISEKSENTPYFSITVVSYPWPLSGLSTIHGQINVPSGLFPRTDDESKEYLTMVMLFDPSPWLPWIPRIVKILINIDSHRDHSPHYLPLMGR
jgi:hypothetical protein